MNYAKDITEINKIDIDEVAILLVEQNVKKALQYASRAYVFKIGEIAFEGSGEELLENNAIEKTFLGG